MPSSRTQWFDVALAVSAVSLLLAVVVFDTSALSPAQLQSGSKMINGNCLATRSGNDINMDGSISCPSGPSDAKKNIGQTLGEGAQKAGFQKKFNQDTTRKDGCRLTTEGGETGGGGNLTCPEGTSVRGRNASSRSSKRSGR